MCPSLSVFKSAFALLLLSALCFASCKATQSKEQLLEKAKEIAITKLGASVKASHNSTNDYILFIQDEEEQTTPSSIKFVVVHIDDTKIVLEESIIPGYVKWTDAYLLEWLSSPGTLRENEDLSDHIKTIDVRTLPKTL